MSQINNSKHEMELANSPISSLFKKFAIPGVIGMLSVGVQSIVDGLIVGNCLGPNALASVSLILPLYSFVAALAIVIGVGSQTLVSVGQGSGDYKTAQNSMTTGIITIIVFCLTVSVGFIYFSKPAVYMLGANKVLEQGAIDYILGLFPFMAVIGCGFYNDYMLKAIGKPRTSMLLMFSSVVLNIILNIIFVTIFHWGTFGVGLATGISFTLSLIVSTYILQQQDLKIKLFKGKYKFKLLWNMLYNGSSEGVSEIASGITILLFNITLMTYLGETGVAAFTVINYIYFIGTITLIGISDGIIPIISYNFGAKLFHRSKSIFKLAVVVNFIIGSIIALILIALGPYIIKSFVNDSKIDVINIASEGAYVYAFAFLLNGFNILAASFFTAITDAKRSVIISALRGLVLIPLFVIMIPQTLGIKFVWYSVPISELITLSISVILIYQLFKRWQNIMTNTLENNQANLQK